MQPIRIALVPHSLGKGEVVLRAYECLGQVGIAPVGYEFNADAFILLRPKDHVEALTTLLAAGFKFREV